MYIQVADRRLHYQLNNSTSTNPEHTIVLIHGLGQNLKVWEPLIPYLSHHRILRYDIAGHGESGNPSDGVFHLSTFSDELFALLSHLKISKATIYGYELGACIVMNFSRLYPEMVARLITVSYPLYYPDAIRNKKFDQYLSSIQHRGLQGFVDQYLPIITRNNNLTTLADAYKNVSVHTYEAILQILKSTDLTKDYERNSQPVLQLVGDLDDQYPPDLMFHAMQHFQAPILVQIPNAKSMVHIDNPEYTAKRIDAFIQASSSQASPLVKEAAMYYASLTRERNARSDGEYHLRIDVIHRFEARINGQLLAGNWKIRKAQELLIYLIYNKIVMREKLYDQFWPHLNLENAQNMLRVSINHLKTLIDKPFGTSFILSRRDRIELANHVESDLLDLLSEIKSFHACEDEAEKELIARKISQAVTPSILEGYYNDWILSLREELLNSAAPIFRWVANLYEKQGRYLDSILYYKHMLKILPEEIELLQKIAALYELMQLKGLAKEWYDRYTRELNGDEN